MSQDMYVHMYVLEFCSRHVQYISKQTAVLVSHTHIITEDWEVHCVIV